MPRRYRNKGLRPVSKTQNKKNFIKDIKFPEHTTVKLDKENEVLNVHARRMDEAQQNAFAICQFLHEYFKFKQVVVHGKQREKTLELLEIIKERMQDTFIHKYYSAYMVDADIKISFNELTYKLEKDVNDAKKRVNKKIDLTVDKLKVEQGNDPFKFMSEEYNLSLVQQAILKFLRDVYVSGDAFTETPLFTELGGGDLIKKIYGDWHISIKVLEQGARKAYRPNLKVSTNKRSGFTKLIENGFVRKVDKSWTVFPLYALTDLGYGLFFKPRRNDNVIL